MRSFLRHASFSRDNQVGPDAVLAVALGAMVAPTPVSALLHSSTMVKAGVYIILKRPRFSGDQCRTHALIPRRDDVSSLRRSSISQSNAKRVLAYSTISNLGLIVACAGINTHEAIWSAILLIIFHALAKSLLFLCVGITDNKLGARDMRRWISLS
jgi:ech hydrogenase subunit A